MEKLKNYLVSQITAEEVGALLMASSRAEAQPGSFMVTIYANAVIIERSQDGDALPFKAIRLMREGHMPVTVYGSYNRNGDLTTGYLVNDPPEPGVTVDDLDEAGRAYVRGERP